MRYNYSRSPNSSTTCGECTSSLPTASSGTPSSARITTSNSTYSKRSSSPIDYGMNRALERIIAFYCPVCSKYHERGGRPDGRHPLTATREYSSNSMSYNVFSGAKRRGIRENRLKNLRIDDTLRQAPPSSHSRHGNRKIVGGPSGHDVTAENRDGTERSPA